jgi:hypothetical protein
MWWCRKTASFRCCGKRGARDHFRGASLKHFDTLPDEIQRRFDAGQTAARQAVASAAHYLGISLANLIGTLNIQKIVLTGSMTRFGELWLNAVNESMRNAALLRMSENTRLELGKLDVRACILGASAYLLLDDYRSCSAENGEPLPPPSSSPAGRWFRPAVLRIGNSAAGCTAPEPWPSDERSVYETPASRTPFTPRPSD